MNNESENATILTPAIVDAREAVGEVARAMQEGANSPEVQRVMPLYELIFYLNHVDYEVKVLQDRMLRDQDNRAVWLKYLVLALYEAIRNVPKLGHAVVKEFRAKAPKKPDHPQVAALNEAIKSYSYAVRPIRNSSEFAGLLKELRNTVAAHHGGNGPVGMTPLVEWVAEHESRMGSSLSPEHAGIFTNATEIGLAIQKLGQDIQSLLGIS